MNNILLRYLLSGYVGSLIKVTLFFYCFGIILHLFEEIEFFKDLNVSIFQPLLLTLLYIPGMVIQLLPFIIFISTMDFIKTIRNNKDLLTMKIYGFSNLKIFFILAFTSFIIGWLILLLLNPITSSMSKYYEKSKSNYAKDVDHLVNFNKNGLWIKENLKQGQRIISAKNKPEKNLKNIVIFNFDENYNLTNKITSKSANIETNEWILHDVLILKIENGISKRESRDTMKINSIYTFEKLTNLFKNFDTLSFVDLLINYQNLINNGYNKIFLNQSLHSLLSMPFFLFIMSALGCILIMNTLKKSNNFKIIIIGLITCVIIYYLKDLSIALGQTNRISLTLAIWIPIIVISMFSFIGILQINEK